MWLEEDVFLPEDDSVPEHDVVVSGSSTHTCWGVFLQPTHTHTQSHTHRHTHSHTHTHTHTHRTLPFRTQLSHLIIGSSMNIMSYESHDLTSL